MKLLTETSRRVFLQSVGAACAWSAVQGHESGEEAFGYKGTLRDQRIEVYRVNSKRWTLIQQVACSAPAGLAIHPNERFLYAANAVGLHQGVPGATVEVFLINRQNGTLSSVQKQALSLSGTQPRNMAITPDSRYLVVAIFGGGAYNVLPIQDDGTLSEARGIFKELGCGVHAEHQAAAHPHTVIFDSAGGFLLTSDFGCDWLSVFALNENGELQRRSKVPVASGAGPGQLVLHPEGTLLFAMHELKPAISCHRYRPAAGIIEDCFQTFPLASVGRLTIDTAGRFLHVTSPLEITLLAINPASGCLSFESESPNRAFHQSGAVLLGPRYRETQSLSRP